VTNHHAAITNIWTAVGVPYTNQYNIDQRLTTEETNIDACQTNITELQTKASIAETNIGSGYDALTKGNIKTRLDALEAKVAVLEAKAAYWVG
jgi:hypothetical protein